MKLSNILFTALAVASAIIGQSCSRHGAATDPFRNFPDDSVLQKVTSVVRTPFSADTTFKFDGREVPTLQIARIFPTQYSDVFYSIRVFAIKGESPVNTCLARIISEDFAAVAGGDIIYNHKARTATDVNAQIDYYGKVFNDTILPQLRQSVVNGFYVNTDLRPCWVSDDSTLYTFSSFQESAAGGGPTRIACYYVTFSTLLGRALTFDDLVPAADRGEVRRQLLDAIASGAGKSSDEYLEWLSDYADVADTRYTVDTYPIAHVALYNNALVFSYPQGMVAPVSAGCPLYFINPRP